MLSILIPAYNEQNILEESIKKIIEGLNGFQNKFEIIVVNNNSNDNTEQICKKLVKGYNQFNYINQNKQGKGNAIKAGFENISFKNILILDADLSVSIDQFNFNWINNKNICIHGSRYSGEVIGTPLKRNFTGKIFSFLVGYLFNLPVDDTQCGFKFIYYTEPKKIGDLITIGNFAYDIDLLLALKQLNVDIEQTPVTYIHNDDTSVKILKDSIKMLSSLAKMKLKYR